jgi:hypothetical protein
MARQVVYIDDIDGSEGAEEVTFAYKGESFAIDLGPASRERFDKAMSEFIQHARKGEAVQPERYRPAGATRGGPKAKATPDREHAQAVRDWGRNNGFNVSDRGRIPAALQEAFDKEHPVLPRAIAASNQRERAPKPPLPTAEQLAAEHAARQETARAGRGMTPPAPALFSAPEVKAETPPQPGSEDSGNTTPDTEKATVEYVTTEGLRQWIVEQGMDPTKVKFLKRLSLYKAAHPGVDVRYSKEKATA